MSAAEIARLSATRDHWIKRAQQLRANGAESQRFKEMSSTGADKARWQNSEDDFHREADAFQKMVDAVVAQMRSVSSGEPMNLENSNRAIFDFAYDEFEAAKNTLEKIVLRFEAELEPVDVDFALIGKLHRAISGMRIDPRTFYFLRLNALDLVVTPEVANAGNGMDGLNWPENLRPMVWDAQRALIHYVASLENLKRNYGRLTEGERDEFSWVFP
jgi:hypothetical protein